MACKEPKIQEGLEWERRIWGVKPRWKKEPDIGIIQNIAQTHLISLTSDHNIQSGVEFFGQGAFNKLYKITSPAGVFIMRVSLPVDPRYKTLSEVCTLDFVRANTDIPVARVFAFDNDNSNELGFEWILMEMVPGNTLESRWRKLSWEAKQSLTKRIAHFQAQLFGLPFRGIGNIYEKDTKGASSVLPIPKPESRFFVSRIVSMFFFWEKRLRWNIPRGPFKRSRDWLDARLDLLSRDQDGIVARIRKKTANRLPEHSQNIEQPEPHEVDEKAVNSGKDMLRPDLDDDDDVSEVDSEDEDRIYDAEKIKCLVEKLRVMLDRVFPGSKTTEADEEQEASILFHDDLNFHNVLVDDSGNITAVIDWECVSTLPLWRACQLPSFLGDQDRLERPNRQDYGEATESDLENDERAEDDHLDSEGMGIVYWEHLLEWEQTQLRQIFLEEMGTIEPRWLEEHKHGIDKAEFEQAILYCDDNHSAVAKWIEQYEKGNTRSMAKLLEYGGIESSSSV